MNKFYYYAKYESSIPIRPPLTTEQKEINEDQKSIDKLLRKCEKNLEKKKVMRDLIVKAFGRNLKEK